MLMHPVSNPLSTISDVLHTMVSSTSRIAIMFLLMEAIAFASSVPLIFGAMIGVTAAETFQSRIQKCCDKDQIFVNGSCNKYIGTGSLDDWPFDTTVVSDYEDQPVQFDIQNGIGSPLCPFGWINHTLFWNGDNLEFFIQRNEDDASVIKIENGKEIKYEDFCIDRQYGGIEQQDFKGFEVKYCLVPPESCAKEHLAFGSVVRRDMTRCSLQKWTLVCQFRKTIPLRNGSRFCTTVRGIQLKRRLRIWSFSTATR